MKYIKTFESFINEDAGKPDLKNYMLFQNLQQIRDNVDKLLSMDAKEIDELISNGHDWAADHITTSKDDIEEVFNFIKTNLEKDKE